MVGLVGLVNNGITKGMDKGSKKMGLVGVYIGLLFASSVPEEQKAAIGLLVIGGYIVVQGMADWIDAWRNPKGVTIKGIANRLSKKLTGAIGYLVFIYQADLSDDVKMKSGLVIVLIFLVAQGVRDGIKALKKPIEVSK